MNVKITSLEATFKTVLVGGRTDMSRERVPDGMSGNSERSLTKLGPCPWRSVIPSEERSQRCDAMYTCS